MAIICIALIAIALCTATSDATLNVQRDVVLLFDSSDEHRSNYFEVEKQFAIEIIEGIYNSDTRIGLYTFGRRAHVQFNLNLYNDLEQMRYAINHMWYSTGNGNLEDAINYAIDNAFTESSGDRECVPNVLFILTHKTVTDISQLASIESVLDQKIIRTLVVNMASNTTEDFIPITGDSSRVVIVPELTSLNKESTTVIQKIEKDLPRSGCGQLTLWSVWSGCSSTCNFGQKFRMRDCIKVLDSDKDCDGFLTDGETCIETTCEVDGGWSFWGNWGGCSKSCENGIQNRFRTCTEPEPFGGGKPCEGQTTDSRNCNDWPCPDCSKTCPPGGYLSADCQLCQCASVTLFGRIMDDMNSTVEGANIFIDSRRNEPIATTDNLGHFRVDGICIMNENIRVQEKRHIELKVTPTELNITHWTFDTIIEKKVAPVFSLQPENKIRMVGQSFTLCCSAVGNPPPTAYKWYKNGLELNNHGSDGSPLVFLSASKEDAAVYKCSTETEAGMAQSAESSVEIKGMSIDTCGPPTTKLQQLPAGCHVTGDVNKNDTLDVGTCGNSACMLSSLKDNGTCSDWWFHQCCDVKDTEMISVTCDGFTYKTTRVTSCECHICVQKTTVSGLVTGKENGSSVPLQLGNIYIGTSEVGRTNMAGYFKFEVTKGHKRLVVTFHDGYFNKFLDVTKIIEVIEGMENHVTIVAPIKPDPVPFNSQVGAEFQLGTGMKGEPPLGSIAIQEDSVVGLNGEPFTGTAKAIMHFVDPRDRDGLDTANGEFVSEVQDGSPVPLETFGLFNLGVVDESGRELRINKKMRITFDTSVLNITLDENGEPDLAIWDYDINKGVWVENTKFTFEQNSAGRKLLDGSIHADMDPDAVSPIETEEEVVVGEKRVQTGWTSWDRNIDQQRPIYEYQPIKDYRVKRGVCYVSVSVYEDLSLKEPYPGSADVTVYTRERDRSKYLGKSSKRAIEGRACIITFCDKLVYLSVKDSQGVNLYPGKHALPIGYQATEQDREITFVSIDRGASYKCPDPSVDCRGPMYQHMHRSDCNVNVHSNSFQFKFAPFTRPPSLTYAVGSINVYDKLLSWYPVPPDAVTFRSCFMKVLVKIQDAYDLRLVAKSLLHTFTGEEFGTHDVGPISSPTSRNDEVRGACFEFRCPGYVRNGSHEYFNLSTAIEVHLTTKEQKRCSFRVLNDQLAGFDQITEQSGDTGFRFAAKPGSNYGPLYGIYIYDKPPGDVEQICNTGTDSGVFLSGIMDPENNAAVEFDCLN